MHPAYSIIFFTVASGAGYGLVIMSLMALMLGLVPFSADFAWGTLIPAILLITAGLVSSTFHLGHPERAWRALSQWRSSWLSREGCMAILTFIPIGATALSWFVDGGWWALSGMAAVICSIVTVYCTAMIYASLKPIPAWHQPMVPLAYVVLALASGGVLTCAVAAMVSGISTGLAVLSAACLMLAGIVKWAYWQSSSQAGLPSTLASGLGLGGRGKVRILELPHTSKNYLQKEMGYKVARKHAQKLKNISFMLGGTAVLLILASTLLPTLGGATLAIIAAANLAMALFIERWLFFAEAQHSVMLYYEGDQ